MCPQLLYFLEDDTLSLLEPRRHNSGLDQGVLVKRHRVPKSDLFKVRWRLNSRCLLSHRELTGSTGTGPTSTSGPSSTSTAAPSL